MPFLGVVSPTIGYSLFVHNCGSGALFLAASSLLTLDACVALFGVPSVSVPRPAAAFHSGLLRLATYRAYVVEFILAPAHHFFFQPLRTFAPWNGMCYR
jgi:hypothetical protein